jgi:hypothetical protein
MRAVCGCVWIHLAMLQAWSGASGCFAQERIPIETSGGKRFAAAFDGIWARPEAKSIRCHFYHSEPYLQFEQDYRSAYSIFLPLKQIDDRAARQGVVALRVTPLNPPAPPAYFFRREEIPGRASDARLAAHASTSLFGGLALGPGRYRLDARFELASGEACRAAWDVRTGAAPELPGPLGAGEVAAVDLGRWKGFQPRPGLASRRATILLHATPRGSVYDRVRLHPLDISMLLGAVSALLNSGHFDSARIVVFQFFRTRIVFEADSITPDGFRRLAEALDKIDIGTIDVPTLQRANTRDEFLARLLLDEAARRPASGDVFFVGFHRAMANSWDVDWPKGTALPFRLTYFPIIGLRNVPADAIAQLVRKAGGRTVAISDPRQFGKLVRALPDTPAGAERPGR